MANKVELLLDDPVLLVTIEGGFSLEGFFNIMTRVRQVLDSQPTPVFHITDFREAAIPLDEMMVGASQVARGDVGLFNHPMIRENIFVTTSEYLTHVAAGLDSDPFGHTKIKIFSSLDEALSYVRSQK